jgi:transporter family-2 protein
MLSLPVLVTLLVGAGLVVQIGLNMAVARAVGSATAAAMANFLVGSVVLLVLFVLLRQDWPTRDQLGAVPWWAWAGGFFGAMYVASVTLNGPRLGAVLLLALTVTGQMVASLVVDHYGLLGFAQQPISLTRVLGVGLLAAGVYLIVR